MIMTTGELHLYGMKGHFVLALIVITIPTGVCGISIAPQTIFIVSMLLGWWPTLTCPLTPISCEISFTLWQVSWQRDVKEIKEHIADTELNHMHQQVIDLRNFSAEERFWERRKRITKLQKEEKLRKKRRRDRRIKGSKRQKYLRG